MGLPGEKGPGSKRKDMAVYGNCGKAVEKAQDETVGLDMAEFKVVIATCYGAANTGRPGRWPRSW